MSKRKSFGTATPVGRSKRVRLDRAASSRPRSETPQEDTSTAVDQEQVQADGNTLLDGVEALEDEQGRIIEPFLRLPSKRQFPDYYEMIERPIAIETIRRSLKKGDYTDIDALKADLYLLVSNAQQYNEKGSFLYDAATQIQEFVAGWGVQPPDEEEEEVDDDEDSDHEDVRHKTKTWRIGPYPDDPDSLPLPRNLKDTIQRIIAYLRSLKDENGRRRALSLDDLPDKKSNPDYYRKITNPIAFGFIVQKSKKNPYKQLERFGDDLADLYLNTINVFGKESRIGQDAIAMRTVSDRLLLESKVLLERGGGDTTPEGAMSPLPKALRGLKVDTPLGPRIRLANPVRRESGLRESTLPPEIEQATYTEPHTWRSSGKDPLITSFSLSTTSLYNPAVLHIRGRHVPQQLTWSLPLEACGISCTPQLNSTLYTVPNQPHRNATLSLRLNGRVVSPSRKTTPILAATPADVSTDDWTPREVQHGIYDLRLSTGCNCIEVMVEADPPKGSGVEGRDRERIAVVVYLS